MTPGEPVLTTRHVPLTSEVALALIQALNAELSATYPEPGATHFRLDPDEVAQGRGAFLVAFDGDTPVGCGGIRRIDEARAELKRMYVAPPHRGRGIGALLLRNLEDAARALGVRQVVLETGIRQGAALELYRRAGYEEIEPFGEYLGSELSMCLGREL